jgi:hypothetical protein
MDAICCYGVGVSRTGWKMRVEACVGGKKAIVREQRRKSLAKERPLFSAPGTAYLLPGAEDGATNFH